MLKLIFWPFTLAASLISFLLSAAGRFLSLLLGLILGGIGVILTLTGIGAIAGVPLVMFGGALMLRAIF